MAPATNKKPAPIPEATMGTILQIAALRSDHEMECAELRLKASIAEAKHKQNGNDHLAVALKANNAQNSSEMNQAEILLARQMNDVQHHSQEHKLTRASLQLANSEFANAMLQSESGLLGLLTNHHASTKAAKTDAVEADDATDLATALTLVNELKAKLDAMNG